MSAENKRQDPLRKLLVLVAAVAILLLIQPLLWFSVGAMAKQFHSDRTQIEQIADVEQRTMEMQRQFNTQRTLLNQLTIVAPRDKDTIRVIERLETLAASQQLSLEVLAISDRDMVIPSADDTAGADGPARSSSGESPNEIIYPLTVSLEVTGSPVPLLTYLASLEHMQSLTTIDSVRLEPKISLGQEDALTTQTVFQMDLDITFTLQASSHE